MPIVIQQNIQKSINMRTNRELKLTLFHVLVKHDVAHVLYVIEILALQMLDDLRYDLFLHPDE